MKIELNEDAYAFLVEQGCHEQFGARELRRAIDRELRQPMAGFLLQADGKIGTVRVGLGDGKLRIG